MKFIVEKLERLSPRFSPTIYKALIVSVLAAAFVIPLAFVALPYLEIFNDMAVQRKGNPQSMHGRLFGEELIVEREPVPGTIPRGQHPYPFEGNDESAIQLAGERLENPTERTRENLEEGRRLYNIYCYPCHGEVGLGDGPVVGPDRYPAPTSQHTEEVKNYRDGSIFHIITMGKGNMPGYAEQIPERDRWLIVNYVRVLHRALDPKPEDLAIERRDSAE
jgi:mono/diheme cytochrome c family protein